MLCTTQFFFCRYVKARKEHLISTVTGRAFQVFKSGKLGIVRVSKQHPEVRGLMFVRFLGGAVFMVKGGGEF